MRRWDCGSSTLDQAHESQERPHRPRRAFYSGQTGRRREGLVLREHFMALGTRVRVEEIPEFVTALRASGSVHNDDWLLRAGLFSELFPDIGFQIIKERIPVKIYRS